MVVNVLPLRDDLPGLTEAPEQLTRQAFISEPAMEAFHESVLPWAARFDVARADVDHIQERPQRLADELRAVVASNVLGNAMDDKQVSHQKRNILSSETAVNFKRDALASEFIDHRQDLQGTPVLSSVEDKIN